MFWWACAGAGMQVQEQLALSRKHQQLRALVFPFLHALETRPDLRAALAADKELQALKERKLSQATFPADDPATMPTVERVAPVFAFSEEEITRAGELLAGHLASKPGLVFPTIVPDARSERDKVMASWREAARGMNKVLDTYLLGKKHRYSIIDELTFDPQGQNYRNIASVLASATVDRNRGAERLFFEPSLDMAVSLLEINERDEALRHRPLDAGENAAAFRYRKSIRWKDYPYACLLIPGQGPDQANLRLDPLGLMRCQLAAARYHQKMAPYILVSGGYAHPIKTPYCEALEMKKKLMEDFQVPARAIIIEPHARHTTTNFRNAARLMHLFGMPWNKPSVCATTPEQSRYIEQPAFLQRCQKELGYAPMELGSRISRYDLVFQPRMESLTIDSGDPLDP